MNIVGSAVALPGKIRSLEDFEQFLYSADGRDDFESVFADDEISVDPLQFSISPRQARFADPQQLLLLDVANMAFSDAGLTPEMLRGSRTGVYVGMTEADYLSKIDLADVPDANLSSVGVGNNRGVAAGRISFFYDLHGPSMQVDSTCSSGLLAMHLADMALRAGEISRALVVASHMLQNGPSRTLREATGAMSRTGDCNAFTDQAAGFTVGEGLIAFVLERDDADSRSSSGRHHHGHVFLAANHDGRTAGLTVPNKVAQEDVLARALHQAGITGDAMSYVEAHGTGTELGDPIEVQALAEAYGTPSRHPSEPLLIGSNKPRFGHLEAASGLLSVLVGTCILRSRIIPGTRSHGIPAPLIDWESLNISLVRENTSLPRDADPVVGVSAFGMSGTNVHAIMTLAP